MFLTDQQGDDIPQLDLTHRGHARVEDRIRQGKDCGLRNLPFQSFAHNRVWLWLVMLAQDLIAWTAQLCLVDAARAWELKRVRYRLLHQSGRIARHARRTILRLASEWPWSGQLADAFAPPAGAAAARLTATGGLPRRRSLPPLASACPKTPHASIPDSPHLSARPTRHHLTPQFTPRRAQPRCIRAVRSRYCKRSDSVLTARSRLGAWVRYQPVPLKGNPFGRGAPSWP